MDLHTAYVVVLILVVGIAEVNSYARRLSIKKEVEKPAIRVGRFK
jgi:hypothetical protein